MRYRDKLAGVVLGVIFLAGGCGKPATTTPDTASGSQTGVADSQGGAPSAAHAKADTPEGAVRAFLDAVKSGNDRTAESMFTDLARERIKDLGIQVAPRGSDTANYEISKAELLAEDGARVPCKWTDIDQQGNSHTDEMTWMLRREPVGWRVAGMAAVIFEGEDPLLLDFENPKETLQKLERLREEMARRTAPSDKEPRQAENPGEEVRR
jgi:hypothetical protein